MLRPAIIALILVLIGSVVLISRSPAPGTGATYEYQASRVSAWYLGVVTTQQTTAQEVGAEFYVPEDAPSVADTYYPLLLSVCDSNSSYDQIGVLGRYGSWAATTSDTRVNGTATIYNPNVWFPLHPGYYWFRMAISKGVVAFTVAYENGTTLLSEYETTGGNSFVISPTFFDRYASTTFTGFSVFEEVYNATGGSPGFNLYAKDTYFISNGTRYNSSWSAFQSGAVPQGPRVAMNGCSVMIMNVGRSLALASGKAAYFTMEPVQLMAIPVGTVGEPAYTWYVDGRAVGTSSAPQFNVTFQSAASHEVSVRYEDVAGEVSSDGLQLEARKVSVSVSSPLGSASGGGLYDFGASVEISVTPSTIPTGSGTRESLVGWSTDSSEGYSGADPSFVLTLSYNVSETALWANQSLVSLRSNPTGLSEDLWLNQGPERIELPAFWNNDSDSRISLVGFSVDGVFAQTGRGGWTYNTSLTGTVTLTMYGVRQYSVVLQGYSGPYVSTSQTGDLWFDSGTQAIVTLPLNYTQGLSRWIFEGWQGGSSDNTITFASIGSSHTAKPIMKRQYFVYMGAVNPPASFWTGLIDGPPPSPYGLSPFFSSPSYRGEWLDAGSLLPAAQDTWSVANRTDVSYGLIYIRVGFAVDASSSIVTSPGLVHLNLTALGGPPFLSISLVYGVDGGKFNASDAFRSSGIVAIALPNGTLVQVTLSSDANPQFEDGQLVVDRPFALGYVYAPQYYLVLRTPSGGFEGWVSPYSGQPYVVNPYFSYSAPVLSGFLGTQRFVSWQGTVNSTSPKLLLAMNEPYVETARYETDYWAAASVVAASVVLLCGAYVLLSHRLAYGRGTP